MKKINQYKRTYYKEIGALIMLILGFLIFMMPGTETYTREQELALRVNATVPVTKENSKKEIEEKIKHYFKKSHETMIAVAYAESGMKMSSINWNCYYNENETIVYETRVKGSHGAACKKSHRKYAFGVDCFVLQSHYPNRKECPKDVTLDEHLQEMAELSKKRGFQPWIAWQNGSFKKYLASN